MIKGKFLKYVQELKESSEVHIFCPSANLTMRSVVSFRAREWKLKQSVHLDVVHGLGVPPSLENFRTEDFSFVEPIGPHVPLWFFLVLLRHDGLLDHHEIKELFGNKFLSKIPKRRLSKPLSKREIIDFILNVWPNSGLPYPALYNVLNRLRHRGLSIKKIVVYNHDPRNQHPLCALANWPVYSVDYRGKLRRLGPYVGQRQVKLV